MNEAVDEGGDRKPVVDGQVQLVWALTYSEVNEQIITHLRLHDSTKLRQESGNNADEGLPEIWVVENLAGDLEDVEVGLDERHNMISRLRNVRGDIRGD